MSVTLDNPAAVEERLGIVEAELAEAQNALEERALAWFKLKRVQERMAAEAFVACQGTAGERKAAADIATAKNAFWEAEGAWEGLKHRVRVLETRANIGMSLLRAQSRLGA